MASGRPVHPLFGGGGMKNELALKAKSMNARHGGISETQAQAGQGVATTAAKPRAAAPSPPATPMARPPHPLFGGGGGLGELKNAAKSMNARHGGISETKAQSGKGSVSASAPPPSPPQARPTNPLMGGGGGMSLQDQIKAQAAKRNARVEAGGPVQQKTVPAAPAPKPMSISDEVAKRAAQRKERLGYNDPVLQKPERAGPRDVPKPTSWMAPAEKWVSAPPTEQAPPPLAAVLADTPTKTTTKTERITKPTASKRIIRRKIIKKADGTQQTITTIIDAATGQEINQDGTPVIKPLAETVDYNTTTTVTKTTAALNPTEENKDTKVVTTDTTTSTSSERPAYVAEPTTTVTRIEPEPQEEEVPVAEEQRQRETDEPVEEDKDPSEGQEVLFERVEEASEGEEILIERVDPPAPKPADVAVTSPSPAPTPPSKTRGTHGPAKVLRNTTPATTPNKPRSKTKTKGDGATVKHVPAPVQQGVVVSTTRTVTTTKTYIPAPKRTSNEKRGLFSAPPMTKGTSTTVVTTTSSAPGTAADVVETTTTSAPAKRGWFGGRKK
mmetsp:Transcript_13425/g.25526  ORF Transcript_13425/g.25526 Transcript_13425/m.25526 type:complete len:556 (-) Transcript_13425:285-1952(-)